MPEEQKSTNHLKRIAGDDLKKQYKAFNAQRELYIDAAKAFYTETMETYVGSLIQYEPKQSGIIIGYEFIILKQSDHPVPWQDYEDERNRREIWQDIVKVKIIYFAHESMKFTYSTLHSFKFNTVGKVEQSYLDQLKEQYRKQPQK